MAVVLIAGTFLLTLLLGIPVAFVLGITAVVWTIQSGVPLDIVQQRMFAGVDSFSFIAIPLFIMTGLVMERAGILERLVDFCNVLVGRLRGALAYVNVLGSMIFAGISGSASADAAGLGPIEIKMMKKAGYSVDFAAALTAISSIIGPIIPPSIIMVLYGITMNVSISQMFAAGLIPGILLGLFQMGYCYAVARKKNFPRGPKYAFKEIAVVTVKAVPVLILPLIIFFGVTSGIFTATESAAIALFYAIGLAVAMRRIHLKDLYRLFIDTGLMTAVVMLMVAMANVFAWQIALANIPETATNFIASLTTNPAIIMLLIVAVLLVVGMFMEIMGALILFAPILAPIAARLGINPLHVGMVIILTLTIGMVTPPVGSSLFITCAVADLPYHRLVKAIMPLLIVTIAWLLLIALVPETTLFLPRAMGLIN